MRTGRSQFSGNAQRSTGGRQLATVQADVETRVSIGQPEEVAFVGARSWAGRRRLNGARETQRGGGRPAIRDGSARPWGNSRLRSTLEAARRANALCHALEPSCAGLEQVGGADELRPRQRRSRRGAEARTCGGRLLARFARGGGRKLARCLRRASSAHARSQGVGSNDCWEVPLWWHGRRTSAGGLRRRRACARFDT